MIDTIGVPGEQYRDPATGFCEEASMFAGGSTYIPCGAKPTHNMFSARDRTTYLMCDMCADHNIRRGMVEIKKPEKKINERELEDNYPILPGYLYVVENKVWRAPENMTVGELKTRGKFSSVKNCDIAGRDIWHLAL